MASRGSDKQDVCTHYENLFVVFNYVMGVGSPTLAICWQRTKLLPSHLIDVVPSAPATCPHIPTHSLTEDVGYPLRAADTKSFSLKGSQPASKSSEGGLQPDADCLHQLLTWLPTHWKRLATFRVGPTCQSSLEMALQAHRGAFPQSLILLYPVNLPIQANHHVPSLSGPFCYSLYLLSQPLMLMPIYF